MIRKQDDIVGSLFQDIAHLIRQRIDTELQPHGLTRLKWLAIGLIQANPGLTQSDLARRLELRPAATGKLVDRLEARGLVLRNRDADDRRIYRLSLTDRSQELLTSLEPVGNAIREDILSGLDPAERRQLQDIMSKLKQRLVQAAVLALALALPPDLIPWADTLISL